MGARSLVVAAALALIGCGPAPDWTSSNGTRYYDASRWDPVQIQAQEDWFLAQVLELPGYNPKSVMQAMSEAEVQVWAEPIPCGPASKSGLCNGLQDYHRLHVRDLGCPFNSALTHEMAHWIQQVQGRDDYAHAEKELWAIADGRAGSCP